MRKVASFIVRFSKLFIVLFLGLSIFSAMCINKTQIEYEITTYLPATTDTKIAIDIMDNEFVTYGTSTILVRNISYEEADELAEEIRDIDGVKSLPFENTEDYYKDSSALFTITFDGDEDTPKCVEAYTKITEMLKDYDTAVSSALVDDYAEQLSSDIRFILIIAVIIIIIVLLLTSKSFAEVIVYLIVFGISALLNMGTNFLLGTISFVSNSVCIILQLALAIDYAIIMAHRFAEEKEKNPGDPDAAMVETLTKGIPEIFGSSLTTIAGLLALCCMSFRLGADLGICLAKSIVCSLLTVFLLMPSLMILFSKAIDKTTHKDFIPKISFLGKGLLKVKHVLPVVFLGLCVAGGVLTFNLDYCYSTTSIDTSKPTEDMVASDQIEEIFGSKNTFVVLVPKGDYTDEQNVVKELKKEPTINEITAISDVDITNNGTTVYLTQEMNYKDFAQFLGINEDVAQKIYLGYTLVLDSDEDNKDYKEFALFEANKDIYTASLLDLIDCAIDNTDVVEAYLNDDPETLDDYIDIKDQIKDAEDQLIGTNYTRVVLNITTAVESEETLN